MSFDPGDLVLQVVAELFVPIWTMWIITQSSIVSFVDLVDRADVRVLQ